MEKKEFNNGACIHGWGEKHCPSQKIADSSVRKGDDDDVDDDELFFWYGWLTKGV